MPYVNVRVAGKLTKEQKQKIAAQIAESLEKVAGKPKNVTYVAFDELPAENWAVGDKLLG